MPSNHSQFMWFFCLYLVLFIRFRLSYSGQTIWKVGPDNNNKVLLVVGYLPVRYHLRRHPLPAI